MIRLYARRRALATPHTLFRSPVSGIAMEKSIVKGMRVMPGDVLYRYH